MGYSKGWYEMQTNQLSSGSALVKDWVGSGRVLKQILCYLGISIRPAFYILGLWQHSPVACFASVNKVPLLGGGEHPVSGRIQGETMDSVKGSPAMGERLKSIPWCLVS